MAYLVKPLQWGVDGDTLIDLLDHVHRRRFRRFPVKLAVAAQGQGEEAGELTEEISRGGMRLRTRREVLPGALERYVIRLPRPLEPVRIEGEILYRLAPPGQTVALAGVRFRRFLDKGEARWIRVIEALAKREAGPPFRGR